MAFCSLLILVAVYQMLTYDVEFLIHIEFAISMYFVCEILLKIFSFMVVDGDIDNFCFNALNMVDFVVVAIDVLLLVAEGEGEESGKGGLLKSLRSLRVIRLIRMTRGMRAMNLMKALKNNDKEEKRALAKADPRSVKINFDMISGRFLKYLKDNAGREMDLQKLAALNRVLTVLVMYLKKYRDRTEVKEDDRSEEERGDPNDEEGIILWEDELKNRLDTLRAKQTAFLANDAPSVIIYMVANTLDADILKLAFELATELLRGGNREVQDLFLKELKYSDADGIFFSVVRKTCRSSAQAGRGTDPHTVTLVAEIRKCNAMLDFLTQLCEGHNLDSQVRVRRAEE